MASFTEELRELNQTSGTVELYNLDASNIGGSIWNITPIWHPAGFVTFGGIQYACFPVGSVGWELSSTGTMPRPTLTVSNVVPEFLYQVVKLGDLAGMKVTRFFTFAKFLDGEPDADPSMHSRREIYYVEQKLEHTDDHISWQLCSPIDRNNVVLPGRQYLRDNLNDMNPDTGVKHSLWAPGLARYLI